MFQDLFGQMKKTLGQMSKWLDAAEAHAKTRNFDSKAFLAYRLAPDQLPFSRQVQMACDTAKLGASRASGKDAPPHADDEETLEALKARIASTIGYLETITAKDWEPAATRTITQPRWEGKTMTGHDYVLEHVVPNFFFHSAHTYALLRQSGVAIGKRDYLGTLSQTAAPTK